MRTGAGEDPSAHSSASGRRRPIAAIFQHFPPYPGAGSIRAEHFAAQIASRQVSSQDLVVLTTVVGQSSGEKGCDFRIVSIGGDPVDNRRSLVSRVAGELLLGFRAAWAMVRLRPRLVVISSPGYLFAMSIAVAARWSRLPYVLDIRDIYPEAYSAAGLISRESLAFRLLSALSRSVYRHAQAIAAATEGLADLIKVQAPAAEVHVVFNGYPAAMRQRTPVRKLARFTCSFHGVLGFYQDAGSLMALARALEPHGVDVIVIGYGRGEEVFAANPPSNLTVTGRLPFAETIDLVARAHVGLCLRTDDPISRDALPVKMFEYAALGLPSIVTPPSEAGRFVERYRCGAVFEAGDIESMAAEVLRLRDDSGYREGVVDACSNVGQEFTREFQAARFADLVKASDPTGRAPVLSGLD